MLESAVRKSLLAHQHRLAEAKAQVTFLEDAEYKELPFFDDYLQSSGIGAIHSLQPEILQLNLGKMCNQVCKHCHVDAGPDRKEIMTRETMELILSKLGNAGFTTVDLTGGAPEMNPHFRWLVEELHQHGMHIMVRCNLTILLANPKYHDLPDFFRKHNVEVISSLPFYRADRTNRQRGNGVFEKSIQALTMLNEVGYGHEDSKLQLNLVYNPAGAFLPPPQSSLENEFKEALRKEYGIVFNKLFSITNLPISRYLEYLVRTDNYESYMEELIAAFNPAAVDGLMCKNTLSVGWDGFLYDCDFNQMLEIKIQSDTRPHIRDIDFKALQGRKIRTGRHCFGCTAGAGSSCGGALV
jgi:radical SAM/Cys-rich protein